MTSSDLRTARSRNEKPFTLVREEVQWVMIPLLVILSMCFVASIAMRVALLSRLPDGAGVFDVVRTLLGSGAWTIIAAFCWCVSIVRRKRSPAKLRPGQGATRS